MMFYRQILSNISLLLCFLLSDIDTKEYLFLTFLFSFVIFYNIITYSVLDYFNNKYVEENKWTNSQKIR